MIPLCLSGIFAGCVDVLELLFALLFVTFEKNELLFCVTVEGLKVEVSSVLCILADFKGMGQLDASLSLITVEKARDLSGGPFK